MNMKEAYLVICASTGRRRAIAEPVCVAAAAWPNVKLRIFFLLVRILQTWYVVCTQQSDSVPIVFSRTHFVDLKSIFWPIWVQTAYIYVHNKMCWP